MYINHSTILKLCRRKPSGLPNAPTYPLPKPSVDSDPAWNSLDNPTSTPGQPSNLPLVLFSVTLHEGSVSQKKCDVVILIIISSQYGHISFSALVDTGSQLPYSVRRYSVNLSFPPRHSSRIIIFSEPWVHSNHIRNCPG